MRFFDFCKEVSLKRLDDYIGENVYLCDLGFMLTDYENTNGSWYYSRFKAEQDVKNWFDELGSFVEYYKDVYGDNPNLNVFENIEGFHCLAVICGVDDIIKQALSFDDNLSDEVELTPQVVNNIKKKIAKIRTFSWE